MLWLCKELNRLLPGKLKLSAENFGMFEIAFKFVYYCLQIR